MKRSSVAESLDSLRESQRGQIGQVCNRWIYESFLSHAFFSLPRCVRARSRTHDPVSTLQTVQINQINRSPLYRYQMASNSVRPSLSDQKVSAGRSQRNSRGALNSQLIATTKASQGTVTILNSRRDFACIISLPQIPRRCIGRVK